MTLFRYDDEDSLYRHEFEFVNAYDGLYVIIRSCNKEDGSSIATGRNIKNEKVIWHSEDEGAGILYLTQKSKHFLNRIVKLRVFW